MKYHLTNIYFEPEPPNNQIRLMKIMNGFIVGREIAEVILTTINAKEKLVVEDINPMRLHTYGIRCDHQTEETINRIAKEKKENEERWAREDIIFKKAEIWYETLSEEEKEMVQQLGYKKFQAYAVG